MMTGEKMARIRRCHICRDRVTCFPDGRQWSVYCSEPVERAKWTLLDDAAMEGPDENCPRGYWRGLVPIDLEAERAATEAAAQEKEIAQFTEIVGAALPPDADRGAAEDMVTRLTAADIIAPEIGVEVIENVRPSATARTA